MKIEVPDEWIEDVEKIKSDNVTAEDAILNTIQREIRERITQEVDERNYSKSDFNLPYGEFSMGL